MNSLTVCPFLYVASCLFVAKQVQLVCNAQRTDEKDNPHIEYTKAYVEIPYKGSFNVSCTSNQPIIWVAPELVHDDIRYAEYTRNDPEKFYGAILALEDASARDVGRYYCVHDKDKEHLKTAYMEGHFASIYVFVRDINTEIVPVLKNSLEIEQYDDFIVPCKPSYPNVELKLCNPLDGFCLTECDPEKGFTVKANTFSVKILQFICTTESHSEVFTAGFISDDYAGSSEFDVPQINYENQSVLLLHGDNLNVTCVSNIPVKWKFFHDEYFDDEYFDDYDFDWNYTDVKSIAYVTNDHFRKYGAILKIAEASTSDVGRYYCIHQQAYDRDEAVLKTVFASIYVHTGEKYMWPMHIPGNTFEIERYDDFIVPCRPSHPDMKVQLCNPLDGSCLTEYNPEKGFVVTAQSFNVKILQFTCKSNFDVTVELTARFKSKDEADSNTVFVLHINNENETVELRYEDNWNVSCVSNKPTRWIRHDPGYDWVRTGYRCPVLNLCITSQISSLFQNSEDLESTEYATNEPDKMYGAIFTITEASASDVGRYYCIQKDSESNLKDHFIEMNQTGAIVSIYVYVNDPFQTIVPYLYERLMINREDHAIIPCKGSHPDMEVKLCNIDSDNCFSPYDPQIGFTVHAGSFSTKYIILNCSSTTNSKTIMVAVNGRFENEQQLQFDYLLYFGVPVLVILLLMCLLISVLYSKKIKEVKTLKAENLKAMLQGDLKSYSPTMPINEQADRLPYNMKYELPREKISLQEQLGEGAFGIVMKGIAMGIVANETQTRVAVKMVKKKYDIEALQALVAELKMMIHLGQHLNVVNLLGAVTENIVNRELMVIVEYCPFGNLLNFLRNNRDRFIDEINQQTHDGIGIRLSTSYNSRTESSDCNKSISTTDLISWAFQIATGMDYLASRKVLHGDLAARNVLLSNNNVVKICDFGLSRSLYNGGNYKKNIKCPLPVRWLALECFSDGLFSTYSDVWAYGILLWELFSLGMVPYSGVELNSDFYKMLRDGFRMECPPFSDQDIYEIMMSCWNVRPDLRPSFKELRSHFSTMLLQETQDYYLALNEPYLAMNAIRIDPWDKEYASYSGSPESLVALVPANAGEYMEMTSLGETT
ncbi:uncharacterized protein LOC118460472 isoform X3 [Anopheles albimanus]|uniref:uncharacterized protein LOC118460472 isoform X3 n=1 Tax=Anopheles albimanus TaxID=7167 RepID=UPI0016403D06|nr:uncharacterized protein LOC118460472 isoform X3 [Anopheles albimanus]